MSAESAAIKDPVLSIDGLDVTFATDAGDVHAVKDLTLDLAPGEVLAIVGESGSGKSVTARSVLGLIPETATTNGAVVLQGRDVLDRKSTRLNSSHVSSSYAVFCLKKTNCQ